jgi:hypothetical protein
MPWMVAILFLFPLSFLTLLFRRGWRWPEAARIGLLTATAFFTAGPFLTESGLGTGEAYNYSEAVADTVVQMRAGVFPVLVGQSDFAFNGRVHPLRTALYFTHAAMLLDFITCHRLSYWGLQNLTLAAGLFGALFFAYACLRRLGTLSSSIALLLAILYGLSPSLLAAAFGMDLYMTVTVAPFLPIALLGALGVMGDRGGINPVLLAVGLAGAWLAHPPVAAWLTVACVVAAGATSLGAGAGTRPLARAAGAAALGIVLGGVAFVSALSLGAHPFPSHPAGRVSLVAQRIIATVREGGWASLRPATGAGAAIGDFQLGYSLWLILTFGGFLALKSGRLRAGVLLAASLLFICLSAPVPFLNAWLWKALPGSFSSLTNNWPMQRSYLVVAACALFVFALSWPAIAPRLESRRAKAILILLACAATGWSVFQAAPFVRRGYQTRIPASESLREHLPSNANLTQTAYSYLDLPRNFTFGTRDPEAEMRLLDLGDGHEILSNATAGTTRVVASGKLVRTGAIDSKRAKLAPTLILEPGKRYRLRLDFTAPRMTADLLLNGETTQRTYILPRSGGPNGFGMDLGNSNTLPLWTDSQRPEMVTVSLLFPGNPDLGWSEFAGYTLEEVDRSSLPIRLERLVPYLQGEVTIDQPCWLETPRMAIPGYQGSVDGAPEALGRSEDGTLLMWMPSGRHHFDLRYRGPVALRIASAVGITGWCFVLMGMVSAALAPQATDSWVRRCSQRLNSKWGNAVFWSSCLLVGVAFAESLSHPARSLPEKRNSQAYVALIPHTPFERDAKGGPLSLTLRFPPSPNLPFEPLLSTGVGPGSTTLFIHYLDAGHIAIGLDQWGAGSSESQPIPIDPTKIQALKLTMPALYSTGPTSLKGGALDWLMTHVVAWLNGHEVFRLTVPSAFRGDSNIGVLRNGSGSTVVSAYFSGDILSQTWLAASESDYLTVAPGALTDGSGPLRLGFHLPAKSVGQCEPLFCIGRPGNGACVFLNYVDPTHVRIGIQGPGTYFFQSPPVNVDYDKPQEVTLSSGRFYPDSGVGTEHFSKPSMDQLRAKTLLAFNGAVVLTRDDTQEFTLDDSRISLGENSVGATYANSHFTGKLDAIDRAPPALWPAVQGDDRLDPAQTVGPILITVQLPRQRTGKNEPLLVTGRPGEGTIIIVRYLDSSHLMLGADVWGKGLYWGMPMETDFSKRVSFLISTSALFPERDSLNQSVPAPLLAKLRQRILVTMDGKVALDVPSSAYDSSPAEITVGRSEIGGSNQEAVFTGTVLTARRLDPLSR